jgi:hypothetical protein
MMRQLATLLIAFSFFVSGSALADPAVAGFELVSSTRVSRTAFDYTYRLRVANGVPALSAVTARVTSKTAGAVVTEGEIWLGNIGASVTQTSVDTFTVRQDRAAPLAASALAVAFIPGPGAVAQVTLPQSQGGVIQITDPASPIRGTVVDIPPGALPEGAETITIGFSNEIPGPLPPEAVAAGIVPVTKTFSFERTGTEQFNAPVSVTIPYSSLRDDFPVVVRWDPQTESYESVQVTSVDPVAGTLTFQTVHFSEYMGLTFDGLVQRLRNGGPLEDIDTSFTRELDGFEAENFTPQVGRPGVCYGANAFTVWFFKHRPAGTNGLFNYYGYAADLGPPSFPQEDAMARELLWQVHEATGEISSDIDFLFMHDVKTIASVITHLYATRTPQLLDVRTDYLPLSDFARHSVIVYKLDGSSRSFLVHDPNFPAPQAPPLPIRFDAEGNFLDWRSHFLFTNFTHDAPLSHLASERIAALFERHKHGAANFDWRFDNLDLTTRPLHIGSYPEGGSTVEVDAKKGDRIKLRWTPSSDNPNSTAVVHTYQGAAEPRTKTVTRELEFEIETTPFTGESVELFAFVSLSNSKPSDPWRDQSDVSTGYDAFIRLTLLPKPEEPPQTGPDMIVPVRTEGRVVASLLCSLAQPDCPPVMTGATDTDSTSALTGNLTAMVNGVGAKLSYSIQVSNQYRESTLVMDVTADIGGVGFAVGPTLPSAIGPVRHYPYTNSRASLDTEFQFNIPELPEGLPFIAYPRLSWEITSSVQELNYDLGPAFDANEDGPTFMRCQPVGPFGPVFDTPGTIDTLPSGIGSQLMGPGTRMLSIDPIAELVLRSGFSTVSPPRFGVCTYTARFVIRISALNRE